MSSSVRVGINGDPHDDEEGLVEHLPPLPTRKEKKLKLWKPLLAEFIGTCIFAFITETASVATAAKGDASDSSLLLGGLVNGFTLVGVIYSLGPVSGAHFNPAVTLGACLAKHLPPPTALLYIVAQILGGMTGTAGVLIVHPHAMDVSGGELGRFRLGPDVNWGRGLFAESVATFVLVFVIFCVVLNPHVTVQTAAHGHIAPLFAPLSVGFTVAANIFAIGNLTGGCMNPARGLGPIIFTMRWADSQVYIIGPLIGGALASLFQLLVFGKDPYFAHYDD